LLYACSACSWLSGFLSALPETTCTMQPTACATWYYNHKRAILIQPLMLPLQLSASAAVHSASLMQHCSYCCMCVRASPISSPHLLVGDLPHCGLKIVNLHSTKLFQETHQAAGACVRVGGSRVRALLKQLSSPAAEGPWLPRQLYL
jgi:hypothetical protein